MHRELIEKIDNKLAVVGVIGLGYVGLPLVRELLKAGYHVVGFDIDSSKVDKINNGESYIKHIGNEFIHYFLNTGHLKATSDFTEVSGVDIIIVCVPTPLGAHFEPDLQYVRNSVGEIAKYLKKGHTVILESTTYPGTTDEELLPMLQQSGLVVGRDFFLGYSPEREDPGNKEFTTHRITKIVSGITEHCCEVVSHLYKQIIDSVFEASNTRVAESAKLLENIYRAVNIALVNELKVILTRMDIDIWEVIEAAKTKPFGFQAFYPGPGLGGHCIPIDPFYLTWKAREHDIHTRFIELAGEINTGMPSYIVDRALRALNSMGKPMKGSKILILGVTYKPDVDDMRESPSMKLIELLNAEGALVEYSDPYIPVLPVTRKYRFNLKSIPVTPENLHEQDLVIVSTDHSNIDYKMIADHAALIIDTRNALSNEARNNKNIWKA